MRKYFFVLIIMILILRVSVAQNIGYEFKNDRKISQYIVDNWSKNEGLPTNSLKNLFQTKDGYIWITSYSGLIRLNGSDFELFDKNEIKAISENGIGDLIEDKKGNLIFTSQNSGLVSYKNGVFKSLLTDSNYSSLFPVIYVDKKNRIWSASPKIGWFIFENNKYKHLKNSEKEPSFFIEDSNDYIWIGTYGNGLIKFKDSIIDNYTIDDGLLSNWINCIYIDENNLFWIGSDKGLSVFDGEKFETINPLNGISINSIVSDKNDNIWIGTRVGLFLKRKNTSKYEHLGTENGLEVNNINNLFVDIENSLWIINYKHGLSRLKSGKFICFTESEGALGSVVNSICEINPNIFLIAYDNGEINVLENNNLKPYSNRKSINGQRVRNIFKDSKNNIWISTYGGLLKILPTGEEKWFKLETGFPDKYIRMTFEDSKGNIWVGTRNKGIIKINDDKTYTIFDKNNGLSVNLIMSIEEDQNGNIIVGTSKGGLSIINNNKIVQTYTKKNGLIDDIVFNIYVDNDGFIWLAVKGGLNCLKDGKITSFRYEDEMLKDSPFDILEDDFGNFWMPCSKGIMKVKKKNLLDYRNGKLVDINCVLYNQFDGLKQSECNPTANNYKSKDGKLWFSTLNGVAMIDPKIIPVNNYVPPVYVEKIFLDNKYYKLDSAKVISPDKKRLTFEFNVLSYYESRKNYYKYKLEGYETEWSEITGKKSISYTNLKPGNYTFKVIACNNDGFWNEKGDEFSFYIMPHFYQTKIFYAFLIILFLLITYIIYVLRIRKLKIDQKKLAEIIKKRTYEITEKNEELKHQKEEIQQQADELEKLSIVASETDNSVMIFDSDFSLIWINNYYINKYGEVDFFKEKIYIKNIISYENIENLLEQCIKDEQSITFESEKKDKNYKNIWVQTTLTPIIEYNQLKKIIVIESDITKIKNAEIAITSQKNFITSSINSAKSIQKTVFPAKEIIDKHFDNFIYFKPKDIVSGDFYWFTDLTKDFKSKNIIGNNNENEFVSCTIFALVDCTGHGVPGAFMSMLGNGLLNEIVNLRKIYNPKDILTELNKDVVKLLKQDVTENVEGMDVALCLIKKSKNNKTYVTFSGSKLPLYYFRAKEQKIKVIRGERKSIGGVFFHETEVEFTNTELVFMKNDLIYLSTDGYIDQNNYTRRRFGTLRFEKIIKKVAKYKLEVQKQAFIDEMSNWQGDELQRDDISIIGIRL